MSDRGIGVEAGLNSPESARKLVNGFSDGRLVRILLEPPEQALEAALDNLASMEVLLETAGLQLPVLLHGQDRSCWPLLRLAFKKGYQTRIGFEDTLLLPNGKAALNNTELVRKAVRIRKLLATQTDTKSPEVQ